MKFLVSIFTIAVLSSTALAVNLDNVNSQLGMLAAEVDSISVSQSKSFLSTNHTLHDRFIELSMLMSNVKLDLAKKDSPYFRFATMADSLYIEEFGDAFSDVRKAKEGYQLIYDKPIPPEVLNKLLIRRHGIGLQEATAPFYSFVDYTKSFLQKLDLYLIDRASRLGYSEEQISKLTLRNYNEESSVLPHLGLIGKRIFLIEKLLSFGEQKIKLTPEEVDLYVERLDFDECIVDANVEYGPAALTIRLDKGHTINLPKIYTIDLDQLTLVIPPGATNYAIKLGEPGSKNDDYVLLELSSYTGKVYSITRNDKPQVFCKH